LRMEDLDAPRCIPGAAGDILGMLEAFGLHSDEEIIYQSRRTAAYEKALQKLQTIGAVYRCSCTRREIADSALHGIDGSIYPGTCRNGVRHLPNLPPTGKGMDVARTFAWRVRTDLAPCPRTEGSPRRGGDHPCPPLAGVMGEGWGGDGNVEIPLSPIPYTRDGCVEFDDALQGRITQHLESEIGDFVVKRADGLFAYQLAVVVDDAFQNITHVVRGADLLASAPRQIFLQHLLGLHTPLYMHLPVAVNEAGEKLSKQTLAAPVERSNPSGALWSVLAFLRQHPPNGLRGEAVDKILQWAIANWQSENLRGIKTLPV